LFIKHSFLIFSSAEQLRVKSGKTMVASSVGKGIANICGSLGIERAKQGNYLQPELLPDLQGKGQVRQRSLSAYLIIHLLFIFYRCS
jgi:hypothetical protein